MLKVDAQGIDGEALSTLYTLKVLFFTKDLCMDLKLGWKMKLHAHDKHTMAFIRLDIGPHLTLQHGDCARQPGGSSASAAGEVARFFNDVE